MHFSEYIGHIKRNAGEELQKLSERPLKETLVIYTALGVIGVGGFTLAHEMKDNREESNNCPLVADISNTELDC